MILVQGVPIYSPKSFCMTTFSGDHCDATRGGSCSKVDFGDD